MTDQPERGPYQVLQELAKQNEQALELTMKVLTDTGYVPILQQLIGEMGNNIDILLGEGDPWGSKAKLIEDLLVTDPLSKREAP